MFENVDGNPLPYAGISQFTPSIPKFYWDVDSQEQGIKQLWKIIAKLMNYSNDIGNQTNINTGDIATLKELFSKFVASGFQDYYADLLRAWLDDNVKVVYDRLAKQVYFGLTDDGYFCAYVPDGWGDITFDTGAVYGTPEYGRLILGFDATGHGIVPARSDYKVLDITVQSALAAAAGSGISYSERKLSVNSGNGLAINSATNMVEVPLGENLRYTSSGIDVPEADDITRGVVKLTHDVNNLDGEEKAITSDGVYAYGNSYSGLNIGRNIKSTTGLYNIAYIYVGSGILLWYEGLIKAGTSDEKTPVVFFEDNVKLASNSFIPTITDSGKMVFRGIYNTNGLAYASNWNTDAYVYIQWFIPIRLYIKREPTSPPDIDEGALQEISYELVGIDTDLQRIEHTLYDPIEE